MAKLVEGQYQVMQMVYDLSKVSHSIASQYMRDYVQAVGMLQSRFPDTIPRFADIHPIFEQPSGRVFKTFG